MRYSTYSNKNGVSELEQKVRERTLELTESLNREKELNELKSRFVSMASHEFRTPLSAILSSVSLIESYYSDHQTEKRKKHIERIKSSVKNLTGILDDFLSIDKLESQKNKLNYVQFNLYDFGLDILEELNGMLKHSQHINFTYKGAKGILQDKQILKSILLNLLSNSIKYSDEHQAIQLLIHVKKDRLIMRITDEGIGIPVDEQSKIFSKFFRARNTINIQGTGLGLNIVKKYIEILGGTISFKSIPRQGTAFIVQLPIKVTT